MKDQKYHYHVEDGQFSIDFSEATLLGEEGEIVKSKTGRSDDKEEIYILSIQGNYVFCLGRLEWTFPISEEEQLALKKLLLKNV